MIDLGAAYDAHATDIRMYILRRVGDAAVADDLLSQVFEDACRGASSYQDRGLPVSAWLYVIAHCRVVDYFRAQRRVQLVPMTACVLFDGGGIDTVIARLDASPLLAALTHLDARYQRVIRLRFLEDWSPAEVARDMHLTVGAVKAIQHRALGALRRALSPAPRTRCRVCGGTTKAGGLCSRHYAQQHWHQQRGQLPECSRTEVEHHDAGA